MRVIELDTAETFYSLRDRIRRGARERIALVVPDGAPVLGGVGLPLLRRLADRERLEIGLVTGDRALARRARGVGLPAFSSLLLAEHYRPGWWRGRRRAERLGLVGGLSAAPAAGGTTAVRLALLALVLLLALAAAALVYALPAATVTLRPASQPAQAIIEVADLPTRPVGLRLAWEATAPGTGAAGRQSARALALQALSADAPRQLAARLAPGERLVPGATRVTITPEDYTVENGVTRLSLTADLAGAAVAEAEVARRVFPALVAALPAGYEADPATLVMQLEAGDGGHALVTARATGRATIDAAAVAAQLAGQRPADAARTLAALPLVEPATLTISLGPWSLWLPRLPLRAARIRVELLP